MDINTKKALKITFTLKNSGIEKVHIINLKEGLSEEDIKECINSTKEDIRYAMNNNEIVVSDDTDFMIIAGGSIAYVKCECIDIN